MIYAGILAAGLGVRMHRQDTPKPFLMLGEKPIILHTLEHFLFNPRIERVIVAAPQSWLAYAEDAIAKYYGSGKIKIIAGGTNKTESILNLVEDIKNSSGIFDGDLLIAHDAVRPFITQRIIDENIDSAAACGAASTIMTTNDTIIRSNNGTTITEIPDKQEMFAEQTPLTFKLGLLDYAFTQAKENGVILSQESELARLCLRLGIEIRLVRGEYSNMKIINPYDLEVANALIKERKK